MLRKLFVALLLLYTSSETSATCRFIFNFPNLYRCQLENVSVTIASDIIDLSGTHIGGRTDADVNEIYVDVSSRLEEIPSMIFTTFENLERLDITYNHLRRIDLTNCGSKLRDLRLQSHQISILQNGAFSGCYSLETIWLIQCNINVIEEFAFDEMPNLIEMQIFLNNFTTFHQNQFRHQSRLEYLRSDNNYISSIHGGAYQFLSSLTIINSRYNNLEAISSGTFTNMPHLERIFLRDNRISTIEAEAFGNVPLLQMLELSHNPIVVFDSNFFGSSLPHLQILEIEVISMTAFDKNIFALVPSLQFFYTIYNNCVSRDFMLIQSFEDDVFPYMKDCFNNFLELSGKSLEQNFSLYQLLDL